jgi:hypothetical protein
VHCPGSQQFAIDSSLKENSHAHLLFIKTLFESSTMKNLLIIFIITTLVYIASALLEGVSFEKYDETSVDEAKYLNDRFDENEDTWYRERELGGKGGKYYVYYKQPRPQVSIYVCQ